MSSIAWNLSRKMEWMARRIRHIDDAGKIMEWMAAMSAINKVLRETDTTVYKDEWGSWRQGKISEKVLKRNVDVEEPAKAETMTQRLMMPTLWSPSGMRGIKGGGKIKKELVGGEKCRSKRGEKDAGKRRKNGRKTPRQL